MIHLSESITISIITKITTITNSLIVIQECHRFSQELSLTVLRTHYDTVQYESTDNLLNEAEFDALCSNHIANRKQVEISLVRSGQLQVVVRDNDKKVQ